MFVSKNIEGGLAMDQQVVACLRRGNPVVFFDISIGGTPSGRIRFELFKKQCPKVYIKNCYIYAVDC